jgi:hypothetical protein
MIIYLATPETAPGTFRHNDTPVFLYIHTYSNGKQMGRKRYACVADGEKENGRSREPSI